MSIAIASVRAIALYRELGFEIEGRRQRALRVDNIYYHDTTMALLFDVAPWLPHRAGLRPGRRG